MTKDVSVSEAEIERVARALAADELGMGDPPDVVESIVNHQWRAFAAKARVAVLALRSNLKEQPVAPIGYMRAADVPVPGRVTAFWCSFQPSVYYDTPVYASPSSPVSRELVIEECAKLALGEIENARRAADPDHPESDYACGRVDAAAAIRSLSPTGKGEATHRFVAPQGGGEISERPDIWRAAHEVAAAEYPRIQSGICQQPGLAGALALFAMRFASPSPSISEGEVEAAQEAYALAMGQLNMHPEAPIASMPHPMRAALEAAAKAKAGKS